MEYETLETEEEYEAALRHAETLMDAEPGSPEEAELDRIVSIIEEYERLHDPIEPPDPVEATLLRKEQMFGTGL